MTAEHWRDIPGFERRYQASSIGRIRSLPRTVKIGRVTRAVPGQILKLFVKPAGYLVCRAGRQEAVHRLVALAWCGGYFVGAVVDHLNGDRADNRPENLEWVSYSENSARPYRNGTRRNPFFGVTSGDHPKSKAVSATCLKTGGVRVFMSAMDAVREGYDSASISKCCNGKQASHKGHRWAFCDTNGIHLTETIRGGFHEAANDRRVA